MTKSSIQNDKTKIILYGPSGSGKSTVGRILARNLNIPFTDLDNEIEVRSGNSIPAIFAQDGEAGFREREAEAIEALSGPGEGVIALGGGALTHPENLAKARSCGRIVLLTAPIDILVSRLRMDSLNRPLLTKGQNGAAGAVRSNLQDLLTRRADHYDSFPVQIDTSDQSPKAVAWQVQTRLGSYHLKAMASKKHLSYDVRVQSGGLDHLGKALRARDLKGPLTVVSDTNVGAYYLDRVVDSLKAHGYSTQGVTIPAGEEHKTLATLSRLWDAFLGARVERGSTVIALGGGVLGDLAGFAAATFLRGIPWVVVPTSLLSMVDSSLGGKTAADLPQGKNLIGSFYPPRLVYVDPDVLDTLPQVELVNGMAEVLKHGVIADPDLFNRCQNPQNMHDPKMREQIVCQAMGVKVRFIEKDPYETGIRAALNYGHTVGHGVERASEYRIRHGEAVAIGMVVEARMAESIGLAQTGLADRIADALEGLGLSVVIPPGLDRDEVRTAMTRDKKVSAGVVKFALPAATGDVRVGIEVPGWESLVN